MAKQKKNDGCLMRIFKFILCLAVFCMLVNIGGVVGAVYFLFGAAYLIFIILRWIMRWRRPFRKIDFDSLGGHEFEAFCAGVLKKNGFKYVTVTKGSGDHGIDILAKKAGKKYAIQCKRYSNNVGNKAVQEAYSGKAIYKADVAVVMTNRYFTKQAKLDADRLEVQLWDRHDLQNFIRSAK